MDRDERAAGPLGIREGARALQRLQRRRQGVEIARCRVERGDVGLGDREVDERSEIGRCLLYTRDRVELGGEARPLGEQRFGAISAAAITAVAIGPEVV